MGGRIGPAAKGGRRPRRGAGFSSSCGGAGADSTGFSSFGFSPVPTMFTGSFPGVSTADRWTFRDCSCSPASACRCRASGPRSRPLSWDAPLLAFALPSVAPAGRSSPRNTWRNCKTTSSSTELECVFPLIPSSFSLSRIAPDLTSKSRASSLIRRDLFIINKTFVYLTANYTSSSRWTPDPAVSSFTASGSGASILSDSISILSAGSAALSSAVSANSEVASSPESSG